MATVPGNRYFLHWNANSAAIRLLVVTGVGMLLWLAIWPLQKLPAKLQQGLTLAGMCLVGTSVIWPMLMDADGYPAELPLGLWIGLALSLLCIELGITLERTHQVLVRGSMMLTPGIAIYWGVAMFFPVHPSSVAIGNFEVRQDAQSPPPALPRDNVYIVIVDDWPLRIGCTKTGMPKPLLPNLYALAEHSLVFADAHSPSCYKVGSVPRLLFQTTDPLAVHGSTTGFWNEEFEPTRGRENLFTQARGQGYRTCMLGWLHPYRTLLGDSVDYVHSPCLYHWYGETWWGQSRAFATDAAFRLIGAEQSDLVLGNRKSTYAYQIRKIRRDLLARAEEVIADPSPGMFVVFHLPATVNAARFALHEPSDSAAQGSKATINTRDEVLELDSLVGTLVQALKQAGKYDNSTLIITADRGHAPVREDIDRATHVPLIVKLPGQHQAGQVVETRFSTSRLATLVQPTAPGKPPVSVAQRLRKRNLYDDLPRSELRRYRMLVR